MNHYELEAAAVLDLLAKQRHTTKRSISAVPTMTVSGNAVVTVDTQACRKTIYEWFRKAGAAIEHLSEPLPNHYRVVYRPVTIGAYVKSVAVKAA